MLFNNDKLYHIGLRAAEGARYAVICGDPARVSAIAQLMDKPAPLAVSREYTSFSAELSGERVLVMSHGIGGPSTAICIEELHLAGVDTVIRVGTCGGMSARVQAEDIVIATAAIRAEGTSREYLPIEFPAVADFEVTSALKRASVTVANIGSATHLGVVHCKDSFYGQHSPSRMPVAAELEAKWKAWLGGGALASEMETAALFTVAATLGMRAGAVLRAVWNQEAASQSSAAADELSAAKTAVAAMRLLISERA